jgi:hypothetical protein
VSRGDRILGIALGIALGLAIIAVFVFVFSEDAIDSAGVDGGGNRPAQQSGK